MNNGYNNLARWIGSIVASITLIYPYFKNGANIKSVYPPIILIIAMIVISFIVIYSKKSKDGMDVKSELFVFLVDIISLGTAIYSKLPVIPFILFWIIAYNYKRILSFVLMIYYRTTIAFINLIDKKPFCRFSFIFDLDFVKCLRLIKDAENDAANIKKQSGFLEAYKKYPPIIYAKHLDRIKSWKGYAFNILLLKGDQIEIRKTECRDTKSKAKYDFKLNVDHTSCKYGIYSNVGKQVIKNWNQNSVHNPMKDLQKINDFFNDDNMASMKLPAEAYYRWSSGGALPIVKYKNETWYVLFVRNINPVGLNIANGASESEEEHTNLHRLAIREFNEEVSVVQIRDKKGDYYSGTQKEFKLPDNLIITDKTKGDIENELKGRKFILHQRYKRNQEEFNNRLELVKDYIEVSDVTGTGFSVEINNKQSEKKVIMKNVVFNINPFENGIECVKLFKFNLEETDTILYGEIWEIADCLVREPVVLISAEYINTYYDLVGSLGTHYNESPYRDCRFLEWLPDEAYHIFGFDIVQREKIFNKLAEELKKDIVINNGKEELKGTLNKLLKNKKFIEYKHHKEWVEKNKVCFIEDKEVEGEYKINNSYKNEKGVNPLKFLCPVSWKTMETIAKYDLNIYLDRDARDNDVVKRKREFYKEYISKHLKNTKKASDEIAASKNKNK